MKLGFISDTHRGFSVKQSVLLEAMLIHLGQEKPDIVLHAGDIGSHEPDHAHRFWKTYRRTPGLETIPTVYVLGNHDYWGKGGISRILSKNQVNAERFNLHYLHGTGYEQKLDDGRTLCVAGFCGWYTFDNPQSNDSSWIAYYDWKYYRNMADREIQSAKIILDDSKADVKILLTHFDFVPDGRDGSFQESPSLLNVFADDVDYIISGHSHRQCTGMASIGNRAVYYNPGGGYEDPKYMVIEI